MRAGCVICGDVFMPNIEVSATPCGHIFHTICVAQWFERSKTCPQCRFSGKMKLLRLYFDESNNDNNQVDAETLQCNLDNAKFQVSLKEQELRNLKEDLAKQKEISDKLREEVKKQEEKHGLQATQLSSMKAQLRLLSDAQQRSEDLRLERDTARAKLSSLQELQLLVDGMEGEVAMMLERYGDSSNAATRNLATVCVYLTKEMQTLRQKTKDHQNDLKVLRSEHKAVQRLLQQARRCQEEKTQQVAALRADVSRLEEENLSLSAKLAALEASLASPSGDAARGALRRLLHENVTPVCLKRPHPCATEDASKSSRARLDSSDSNADSLDPSPAFNDSIDLFEDSIDSVDPQTESRLPSQDPAIQPTGGLSTEQHASGLSSTDQNLGSASRLSSTDLHLQHYAMNATVEGAGCSPYLQVKRGPLQLPPRRPAPLNKPPSHTIFNKKLFPGRGSSTTGRSLEGGRADHDGLGGRHKEDYFPQPACVRLKKRPTTTTKLRTAASPTVKTITNFFSNTFGDT
ncbi:E3 ubiquitin-protein ligase TRAIP-like [Hyalella azteca]|uniref:E3 ubiquitin-protein ligase TRAIP-like n=1 Tax=Hyalella azteca TaxID=294128 RepID=A0A8B7PNC5_HYAAZ|nr:E3 ubiquitin-protein ligase TRAIP-like [Hyalella azteca]XP_047739688.1 E3 ubiquitin-protein ligase TRAIP-like [Hyalella azteca]